MMLAVLVLLGGGLRPVWGIDSTTVKRWFADPPREYATAPLWVWNDRLTETQVRDTLRDLAGQRVKQAFVHPRPGLMTPYLSDDWFRLWRVALSEAEVLDMNLWIYDENSYPSGFAGGWVPELMPESRGRGLHLRESSAPPALTDALLAVQRVDGDRLEDVTARLKAGETLGAGRYVAATVQRAGNSPWHGNRCYVDLLYPGVTAKFLEVTLDAYRRQIGDQFGRRVPGVFTDEPNIRPAGGFPWTDDLPDQFQQRWGYDLRPHLASLTSDIGDWRRVRHNYFWVLNHLFVERWAKPYYAWCETHQLEFTGHYWDHEWPNCLGVPDNLAMAAWQQRPGVDCLMNQYAENTHAQFGNIRYCREVASIANQLGRKRTLVELYGAGGWDLRLEDMKRIGDWLQVLGVNTLDEHLSYITLRGARKRDHPQSFSYHEPWWEAYHVSAGYFARLSAALAQGQQLHHILVLEPTTTAWMYQEHPRLKALGDGFFELLRALEAAQIEYDLASEDVLARFGTPSTETVSVNGQTRAKELRVGQRQYHTIVLPPWTENLDRSTQDLLDRTACQVLLRRYSRVDGQRVGGPAFYEQPEAEIAADVPTAIAGVVAQLRAAGNPDGFEIIRQDEGRGILFHHRRQLDDGELLFLVNTSRDHRSRGIIRSRRHGAERWNLDDGRVEPWAFTRSAQGLETGYDLPPSGSLLLFLSEATREPDAVVWTEPQAVPALDAVEVQRLEPNVLTLDYVDVTAGGETRSNSYFYPAQQFVFQKNGLERNPWDSAVQFRDELISRSFPPDSGFTATYRFTIEGAVPPELTLVVERPDLYTIRCNGQPITARPGEWWLDKAFGRISLARAAQVGENEITLKAAPFTIEHELEPAYVLGRFTLKAAERGFVIVGDQPPRLAGPDEGWNRQGHPFYAAGVAYRQRFNLPKLAGRYQVRLPQWYGSVARVRVNGDLAGYITAPPWELDLSSELVEGDNTVEVTVIGTLKNTLGPHHGNPGLGSAWPGMFHQGPNPGPPPGAEYHTVSYGLFEPFRLECRQRR